MKRSLFILASVLLIFTACNNSDGYKEADSGLLYKFHKKNKDNRKPQEGDVIVLKLKYEAPDGKLLFNSGDQNRAYMKTLKAPSHRGGGLQEALAMMHINDSASFKINAFKFYRLTERHQNLPEGINKDDKLTLHIRLLKILDKKDFGKHLSKAQHKSKEKEKKQLKNYLKLTNTKVSPDSSGLYIIHENKGNGIKPDTGDIVKVHYTLKLISGKFLETSLNKKPMTFKIGEGNVIKGLDIGLQKIKKGGKARLLIPSELAYGKEGKNNILPYSTLIYEIELLDVK